MHILLVADGRSPIARGWLRSLLALDYHVTLLSTYPCEAPTGIEALHVLPVAFNRYAPASGSDLPKTNQTKVSFFIKTFRRPLSNLRYMLGPLSVQNSASRYRQLVELIKPDLVHALRIPFEGMLASYTPSEIPLAVSIWGNDLTLHAPHSRAMASATRRTLERADGLHADTQRDQRLAQEWGFPAGRPALVAPSNGGIDLDRIIRDQTPLPADYEAKIPENCTLVINPRGLRAYTCTNTFFDAIPLILQAKPDTAFLCPGMAGRPEAEQALSRIQGDERVILLPSLPQNQLWHLFTRCPVSISVTTHDGTPNTLLEAMACGSFPVAGDIEALREWLIQGKNGLLVNPHSPQELAEAVLVALNDPRLRTRGREVNLELVRQRAEVAHVRPKIAAFYQEILNMR